MKLLLKSWTILVVALLYLPLLVMVAYSLNASRYAAALTSFTLGWYREVFRDSEIAGILTNTVVIALGSTLASTVLGTMAALGLRGQAKGRRFVAGLLVMPVMIPDIVIGISLLVLFRVVGVPLSLGTALIAHTTCNIAYVALVVSARLAGADRNLELAARDLGATPWMAFWKVTLPNISPAVLSGALLAFTVSFDDFVLTYFTTGPGGATLPVKIFSLVRHSISPKINALTTLILLASVILIMVSRRMAHVRKVEVVR